MAGNVQLALAIKAINEASATLKDIQDDLDNTGRSADGANKRLSAAGDASQGMGKAMGVATLAVAGAGAVIGAGLYKIGSDFDDAYDTIQQGTGATGQTLESLKGTFRDTFASVPEDMGSAATAIASLNTATGATGNTLQDMATNVLDLTHMVGGDVATHVQALTQLTNGWGIANGQVAGTLDKLFVASQSTGVGVDEIANNVTRFGPALRSMGFDLDTSIAMLSSFQKNGVDVSQAMMGLTKATANWAKEGKSGKEGLEETVAAIKGAKSPTDALAIAVQTFGTRAGPQLADAIRSGKLSVDDLVTAIGNSKGTIQETEKSTADFGEAWTQFKNQALVALEPVATKIFEVATNLLQKAGPAVATAASYFTNTLVPAVSAFVNTKIAPIVESIADAFERWGPTVLSLATTIAQNLQPPLENTIGFISDHKEILIGVAAAISTVLVAAFIAWAVAAGTAAIATIAAAAPVLAVALAIGVLTAGVLLLINNWDSITAKVPALGVAFQVLQGIVSAAWTAISGYIQGAWTIIQGVFNIIKGVLTGDFSEAWKGIQQVIQGVWDQIKALFDATIGPYVSGPFSAIWTTLRDTVTGVWNAISGGITTAWETISGIFDTVEGAVSGALSTAWTTLQSTVSGVWDAITGAISTAWGSISGTFSAIEGAINGALADAWNGITTVVSNVFGGLSGIASGVGDTIANIVKGGINGVIGDINGFINAINKIQIHIPGVHVGPVHFGGFDWGGLGIPTIPPLALGGIITKPTLALVGEAGEPEAVVPLSRARQMGFGGGGATVIVQVSALDSQSVRDWLRRGGADEIANELGRRRVIA